MYPFRPKDEFGYLSAEFSELCKEIAPFQVMFRQFSFFEHGHENYTIWLAPSPKDPLVSLQETLLSIVPECDDVNRFASGFAPHLSVGQVRGKLQFNRLRNKLQDAWQPLSFIVREISLIWRDTPPDDIFQVRSRVELKRHKA
jgi:2'-5' RNA ligase